VTGEFYATLPPRLHLVGISRHQVSGAPEGIHHAGMVYNGIPVEYYPLRAERRGRDGYLCFLGRASPNKGPDTAIRVAARLGRRLVMMVKIKPGDVTYWQENCEPLLEGADVEVHRDARLEQKANLLAGADAMLFPIQWDEPFGLVMAEAMTCGTPVIAYRRGAASEVVVNGLTGFLVDSGDVDAFADAVARVGVIDPAACRAHVERNFSTRAMVEGYLRVYQQVVSGA
jgi:glycosyltransferase involved in cell wall biosynthesis